MYDPQIIYDSKKDNLESVEHIYKSIIMLLEYVQSCNKATLKII